MISARPRILVKVTFLENFALECGSVYMKGYRFPSYIVFLSIKVVVFFVFFLLADGGDHD